MEALPCYLVPVAVIFGIPVVLATVGSFLKYLKTSSMMKEWKRKLENLEKSWDDGGDLVGFDPTAVVTHDVLDDMKDRLKNRIVNDNLESPELSPYGLPTTYMDTVANHITDFMELTDVNQVLSQFQHFKTVIGDVNLHFIHMVGSEEKRATPIILLHGWPSTIWEFHKSIPLLVQQGYTVVAPSLPGHGFTDPAKVPGVSPTVIACICHKLMKRLGYNKYIVQGGDWGSIIGAVMAYVWPESVLGLHNTMNHIHFGWRQILQLVVGLVNPKLVYTTPQEEKFINPLSGLQDRMWRKFGFFHVQTVEPDQVGYGLVDSPTALIGYVGVRYVLLSSPNNDPKEWRSGLQNFGVENVAANLLIFFATRTVQGSMRMHYDFYWNDREYLEHFTIPRVPVAISNFPNEMIHLTKFVSWRTFNNIKQYTYHDKGGHFAHIDNTEAIVKDLTSFIQLIGK